MDLVDDDFRHAYQGKIQALVEQARTEEQALLERIAEKTRQERREKNAAAGLRIVRPLSANFTEPRGGHVHRRVVGRPEGSLLPTLIDIPYKAQHDTPLGHNEANIRKDAVHLTLSDEGQKATIRAYERAGYEIADAKEAISALRKCTHEVAKEYGGAHNFLFRTSRVIPPDSSVGRDSGGVPVSYWT